MDIKSGEMAQKQRADTAKKSCGFFGDMVYCFQEILNEIRIFSAKQRRRDR